MGWSTEVHDSRVTTAIQQAKREARLRRAHKLPEPQGNAGGWPLAAVAGILLSAAALQRDRDWQRATSKFQQLLRQLPIQGTWSQKQRQQVCCLAYMNMLLDSMAMSVTSTRLCCTRSDWVMRHRRHGLESWFNTCQAMLHQCDNQPSFKFEISSSLADRC